MTKLENSQEVTRHVTNKFQLITLVKWDKLQYKEKKVTRKRTPKQQTSNRQVTPTKESKEIKEEKKSKIDKSGYGLPGVNLKA